MRDAVKFLIDRMDTNPEEFLQSRVLNEARHDWIPTINDYKKYFSDEEKQLVQAKLSEINLEHMKKFIAERLLSADQADVMREKEEWSKSHLQQAINRIQQMQLEEKQKQFLVTQQIHDELIKYKAEGKL